LKKKLKKIDGKLGFVEKMRKVKEVLIKMKK